jgi:hypothetical protein
MLVRYRGQPGDDRITPLDFIKRQFERARRAQGSTIKTQ